MAQCYVSVRNWYVELLKVLSFEWIAVMDVDTVALVH